MYPYEDKAHFAAVVEANYDKICDRQRGSLDAIFAQAGLKGYELLETITFEPTSGEKQKALAIRGPDGELYVHYRGTGDGNWGYNTAVYDKKMSEMQKWACETFERIFEKYRPQNKVYVTGHSQGGHNAQYVTLHSRYGDMIDACVSLDGPGHSSASIEEFRRTYGDAYFEQQREKIYAYNGMFDYVSCLGQEQIVPDGHTFYVETPQKGSEDPFTRYHSSDYLLTNDRLNVVYPESSGAESDFRKFVKLLNEKIKNLSQEDQEKVAKTIMQLCENFVGKDEPVTVKIDPEGFEHLKTVLVPILVEVLENRPDLLESVLSEIQLDQIVLSLFNLDEEAASGGAIAALTVEVLHEFNKLPPAMRRDALELLLKCVSVDPSTGELGFKPENLDGWEQVCGIFSVISLVWETVIKNPDDIWNVIQETGADQIIVDLVKNHPLTSVALVIIAPFILPKLLVLAGGVTVLVNLIEAVVSVVSKIAEFIKHVTDFVVNSFNAIKRAVQKFAQWLHNTFNAGVRYVRNNPYFKVDTDRLREYAGRIAHINRRLRALDRDMNGLYWQVGLLDIWDILSANLLTSQSPTLCLVQSYLNEAASAFEEAENLAHRNFQ